MRWQRFAPLAAVAAMAIIGCSAKPADEDVPPLNATAVEFISDPLSGAAYTALYEHFPAEFAAFIKAVDEKHAAGLSKFDATVQAWDVLAPAINRHAPLILHAPNDRLMANIRARDEMITGLEQQGAALCANYGVDGSIAVDQISDASLTHYWTGQATWFQALGAARLQPIERPTLTPEAQTAFGEKMTETFNEMQAARTNPTKTERDCDRSRAFIHTLTLVPPDDAGTLLARELMKTYDKLKASGGIVPSDAPARN